MLLKRLCRSATPLSLTRGARHSFQTMSAEDYLFNQREATVARKPQIATLSPLPLANHGEGTTDEINLIGVPLGKTPEDFKEYDTIASAMERNHPDLVFLQFNPGPYMARQRFLAHKCALKEVEDYHKAGVRNIDPIVPHTWEETVVNLVTLDMLKRNQVHTEFNFLDGFSTYSYPYIQDKQIIESNHNKFIESISENVVGRNFSDYFMINKALYTSLMGKHRVMLGDMPEPLLRMQLGNTVSIEEMRDLFKYVLGKMKELKEPISMKEATLQFLPHIFQLPKDLYMTALLKETFQAATMIVAFIGAHHVNPIQRYWTPPPNGINWTEATRVPERLRGETDDILIEKQAIMDVMMGTKVWGENYLANPFTYVEDDITKISDNDFSTMKKCFALNYKKYTSFKNQQVDQIPNFNENLQ